MITSLPRSKRPPADQPRYLIVNADDFGMSAGVNHGIIRSYEEGILTSASLMVRGSAAIEAANYARRNPDLSVGLHLDLAEWEYRDSEWFPVYQIVPTENKSAVTREVSRQLRMFRRLTGRNPTHLDSHQHLHRREPVRSVLMKTAARLSVPVRDCTVRYCGDFYGQTGEGFPYPEGITTKALLAIFRKLPPGVTEMGCHPGEDDELDSIYRAERTSEMNVLCHPRIRTALDSSGIKLCSFATLPRLPAREKFS